MTAAGYRVRLETELPLRTDLPVVPTRRPSARPARSMARVSAAPYVIPAAASCSPLSPFH
jgi:hypothetical protein